MGIEGSGSVGCLTEDSCKEDFDFSLLFNLVFELSASPG
jgi:hypothetical protein